MDQQQQEEDQQQQQQGVVPVQPQPGVAPKCPRCDSMNTKFCYYNNYSLSQPRYFCKTCRRYWTHGGTLRNVPVGGGCRKGKRPKISSSDESPPQKLVAQNHLTPTATFYQGGGSGLGGVGTAGGYFASLAGLNNLNHHPPTNYPFDQSLINVVGAGVGGSGCSNLGLLQGFNAAAFLGSSSSSSSQRQNPQQQFYQLGNGGMELLSLYNNSEQGLVNNTQSTMANNTNNNYTASAASMLQTQSFMNSAAAANGNSNSNSIRALSDASLWSTISTTYINGGNNSASDNRNSTAASGAGAGAGVSAADYASASAAGGSNSRVPNQWFDLQRFQPPPQ